MYTRIHANAHVCPCVRVACTRPPVHSPSLSSLLCARRVAHFLFCCCDSHEKGCRWPLFSFLYAFGAFLFPSVPLRNSCGDPPHAHVSLSFAVAVHVPASSALTFPSFAAYQAALPCTHSNSCLCFLGGFVSVLSPPLVIRSFNPA